MTKVRMLDALLRLYPPWWRARYGDEVRAVSSDVIAAGRPPWRVLANLFTGAVRLRATGANTPRQFEHWAGRARASIAVATFPVLLAIPVIVFSLGRQQISPGQSSAHVFVLHAAGRVAVYANLVMVLALLSVIGTVFGGYLQLMAAVRRRGRNDRRLRRLVWIPGISTLLIVVLWVLSVVFRPNLYVGRIGTSRPLDGHPALAHGFVIGAAVFLGVGLTAALVMVVQVARRGDLALPDLSSGKSVSVTTSILLWVTAGAAVTSVVAAARQGSGNYGVVTSQWGQWWIGGVVALVLAAVVSTMGTVTARRSFEVAAQLGS